VHQHAIALNLRVPDSIYHPAVDPDKDISKPDENSQPVSVRRCPEAKAFGDATIAWLESDVVSRATTYCRSVCRSAGLRLLSPMNRV
jgi:hypothetical protein